MSYYENNYNKEESEVCMNENCKNHMPNNHHEGEPKFWSENPNVLLDPRYLTELFPTESMCYSQKLNAVSRLVIVLTVIGFLFTRSIRSLIISLITLMSIYFLHHTYMQDLEQSYEGFENPAIDLLMQNNIPVSSDSFMEPSSDNPFSNVLLNDYDYNPEKKPAPPVGKPNVNTKILEEAKQLVQNMNPSQPDIANKLFKDLGNQYVFEQSLMPFYSNPSTTIPNDQTAFADFCYGSMVSCKEGNPFACAKNLSRHTNV
jgi:hypothetical protein